MRARAWVVAFVVGCAAVLVGVELRWNVVRVRLGNHAARAVTDVRLAGRCFERSIARLDAGESRTYWVRPCGESGVDVAFRAGTVQVTRSNLGYIEPAGGYAIELVIGSDMEIAVER